MTKWTIGGTAGAASGEWAGQLYEMAPTAFRRPRPARFLDVRSGQQHRWRVRREQGVAVSRTGSRSHGSETPSSSTSGVAHESRHPLFWSVEQNQQLEIQIFPSPTLTVKDERSARTSSQARSAGSGEHTATRRKNRIRDRPGRTSGQMVAKSAAIKSRGWPIRQVCGEGGQSDLGRSASCPKSPNSAAPQGPSSRRGSRQTARAVVGHTDKARRRTALPGWPARVGRRPGEFPVGAWPWSPRRRVKPEAPDPKGPNSPHGPRRGTLSGPAVAAPQAIHLPVDDWTARDDPFSRGGSAHAGP